nr:transcriptional regulator [Vibrio anguillarum]
DFGIPEGKDELTTSVRCAFLWIMEKEWFIDNRTDEEKSETKTSRFYKFELLNAEMLKLVKASNL